MLVVSSSKDAHSSFVYPTHPYTTRQSYRNLTLLPDPCIMNINGVVVGISTTDVLTHLLEAELAM